MSTYLADLPWRASERTDFQSRPGQTIDNEERRVSIRGTQYEHGIGAHSYSVIRISVSQSCETFVTDLGVDDETGGGYVVMQVWADSTLIGRVR